MLRAGVIGAGVFGGHHARKYARTPGVEITAVFDPLRGRAEALAADVGAEAFVTVEPFLDWVDVVTVASPANTHAVLAGAALAAGKPVYVEKPLATNLEDGDALVGAAAARSLVLACGHQERAVITALGLYGVPEKPVRIEAVRRGTPSGRNADVSCVLDLMIHDLDLALQLSGAEALTVEADGDADALTAEAIFADGLVATFDCARNAEARDRRLTVVYRSGEVTVDLLARTVRNTTAFALDPDFADTPAGRDPLSASVDAFLAAVWGQAPRPLCTGAEALAALDLALAVEQAAGF